MKKNKNLTILLGLFFMTLSFILLIFANLNFYKNQGENNQSIAIVKKIVGLKRQSTYLVAGGDIMLSRNIGYLAKKEGYDRIFSQGNYNPILYFTGCINQNCILFFNLESLFNEKDNDIQKGGFDFRANTGNIQTLLQLKQNHKMALSLANNHTINTRYSGVITTKDILDFYGIYHMGVGLTTGESRRFSIIDQDGIKICIGAYSYEGNYIKVGGGMISRNSLNESEIKQDIQNMKDTGCDVKVLSLHWGAEYRISPNGYQKQLAHNLIDSGADLILGGHSHVPGEIEKYNGKYVFYSLGNFIFDQTRGRNTPGGNYDHIYDHSLNKNTVPTYIGLLAGFNIEKTKTGINIILDDLKMNTITEGQLQPLDGQTYSEIIDRIIIN